MDERSELSSIRENDDESETIKPMYDRRRYQNEVSEKMWKNEVEELKTRKTIAYQMGGEKNISKQHSRGKMTVRERIDLICDRETFRERGVLAGVPTYDEHNKSKLMDLAPCSFVMGIGKIGGRRIAIHGDDFTVKGASVGRMYKSKGAYFVKMARFP